MKGGFCIIKANVFCQETACGGCEIYLNRNKIYVDASAGSNPDASDHVAGQEKQPIQKPVDSSDDLRPILSPLARPSYMESVGSKVFFETIHNPHSHSPTGSALDYLLMCRAADHTSPLKHDNRFSVSEENYHHTTEGGGFGLFPPRPIPPTHNNHFLRLSVDNRGAGQSRVPLVPSFKVR
jgi:hypothetical protein